MKVAKSISLELEHIQRMGALRDRGHGSIAELIRRALDAYLPLAEKRADLIEPALEQPSLEALDKVQAAEAQKPVRVRVDVPRPAELDGVPSVFDGFRRQDSAVAEGELPRQPAPLASDAAEDRSPLAS